MSGPGGIEIPYILDRLRRRAYTKPEGPGELTYKLYRTSLEYEAASYSEHCQVVGSLVCTAMEYYRRKVAPYEDAAIALNGDVYPGGPDS